MLGILGKSFATGIVTSNYPAVPPAISRHARGRPEIDWANWRNPRPATAICPTGAISCSDAAGSRAITLDLGKCVFCGLCAEADRSIHMTNECELATRGRDALITVARYQLKEDGTHAQLLSVSTRASTPPLHASPNPPHALDALGTEIKSQIDRVLGRSLHIREVDAGSCNGCEVEIVGLNSPVYDIERFGIHFVASPRHADMLLVTGPVTRNMELALRKTYDATPDPRLVVAVGACGCSGGIFGQNYASLGGIDQVIPVDVYVPGCPPNPHALLHGILLAIGRL